ncbi:MAG: RagB/SusD family nutrient uptake outer membrane protein [Bacteroidales bacterium]|nr:MAG: RagB/SusD family nutrient uptake outer membrane protein [Bacteroidales bacterium]
MKKLHVLIIAIILLSSCEKDFLDRSPLDQLSQTSFWKTPADALAAVNGCYAGWEDGYNVFYTDCATDNAYNPFPWEGFTVLGSGLQTPTDFGTSRYSFTTVRKCNDFLENIDKVVMDENLRKRYKAEVRFIRAYQYFIMTQYYGAVPLVTKTLAFQDANVPRDPKTTVVNFILNELSQIAPDLPVSYSGSDIGRITSGAAYGLKARLELFEGKYADCITSCQSVMGLGYQLYPNYRDLFREMNANNQEVILDVQYKVDDSPNWIVGVLAPGSLGGWCSINPTQKLVDAYEMNNGKTINDPTSGYNPDDPYKNRDPRLDATIIYPGSYFGGIYYNPINESSPDYYAPYGGSKTGYLMRKYEENLSDFADVWNTGLNTIVMRYAEILLTYAEAKIESNQIDGTVYNAINDVRLRAGMPVVDQIVYNDQTTLRELVRRERQVELAMEGLRWFDIARWRIAEVVMSGPLYGSRLGDVDPDNGALTLTTERIFVEDRVFNPAKNYLWPIPQSAIDVSKGVLTQNPNY